MKLIEILPDGDALFHPDPWLLLPGRPMFFPDFGSGWHIRPRVAIRICRLGKGVNAKFASRYYDALTLALTLEADNYGVPAGLVASFDAMTVCGEWIAPEEFAGLGEVSVDAPGASPFHLVADLSAVDRAIEAISLHTTIKMGDILLLPLPEDVRLDAAPRTRLTASAQSRPGLLTVKIV